MLKDLKFILKENMVQIDEEGNILPGRVSNVGYKFTFGSELYGSYMVIRKPTMTLQDIMDCLEVLCPEIEQLLGELTDSTEIDKLRKKLEEKEVELMNVCLDKTNCDDMIQYILDFYFKRKVKEVFDEIEFDIHQLDFDRDETRSIAIEGVIANLKKKYTEDPDDIT